MSVTLCSSSSISNNYNNNDEPCLIVPSCTNSSKNILRMNNDSMLTNGPGKSKPWIMKKLEECNPSLVLENKASVARDHLANERTFLAWLRTSLSFISIGIAITQLFRLTGGGTSDSHKDDKVGKGLGIAFIVLGIIFLGFGLFRYFNSQQLMTKGHFPASRVKMSYFRTQYSGLRDFSPFDAFKHVQDLSKPVQQHLLKVYLTLSSVCLVTAAGAFVHTNHLFLFGGGLLSFLIGLGSLIGIMSTPDTPQNKTLRYGLLYNFAFMEGLSIGPLVELTLMIPN
ncbi:5159_t:CDS:2, partial [Dentiscutata heterogama]